MSPFAPPRLQAFYADHFVLPLPPEHRFPMAKYERLRERLSEETGVTLRPAPAATDEDLALVHGRDWIERVVRGELTPKEVRNVGFPWSLQLVERSRRSVGATIAAARGALAGGYGANLAGGTHHGFEHHGEGFCVFNDVAVAARVLARETGLRRVLIADLDVHQGNGTASIFREDREVFTLSVHGRGNYPFRKERSDLDLALDDGTGDAAYLDALERALDAAFDQARPELVFYLAGADPFIGDRLGRLALTRSGLAARDAMVFDRVDALGLPCAISMAGGYAESVDDIVAVHFATVQAAARRLERRS